MTKQKLRKIIVNNITYYWGVYDYNCDGDGSCKFSIWKDKKIIFNELILNETITPSIVKEKILHINEKI